MTSSSAEYYRIPDKCVKALDKYLDDALTEDKE